MIQRIQTLYYFLAAISLAAMFFFPFASSEAVIAGFFEDQQYDISDHVILITLTMMAVVAALTAIFLYRNRPLQLRLGYLIITLSILVPAVAVMLLFGEETAVKGTENISDRIGMYLPVVSILFAVLANFNVKKDEKTVKSMDRLR